MKQHYIAKRNININMMLDKYSYYAMLTINFNTNQPIYESIALTNKVLHGINRKIYSDNYWIKYKFIEGFAVVEKNYNYFGEKKHLHMLIINNNKINLQEIDKFMALAVNVSKKLKDSNNRYAFEHNKQEVVVNNDGVSGIATDSMHIIQPYNNCAFNYITKTIKNDIVDELLLLSVNGLIASDKYYNRY